MKRLYVIDCNDENLYYDFIKNIKDKIPNIRILNYYKDVLYEATKVFISEAYINNSVEVHKKLHKLEDLLIKLNKSFIIENILFKIHSVDTPRSIVFILIKDRILIHHIRRSFKNVNMQIIKIKSPIDTLKIYDKNPISKHDKIIEIIEENSNLIDIVTKNFTTDIPVKWFINNK